MAWKVLFCTPTRVKPHPAYIEALEKSIPLVTGAGYAECYTFESGNPYISAARATMLKKGLDAKCDMFVFLDDDLSWAPGDLLKLVQTPGDVVAGSDPHVELEMVPHPVFILASSDCGDSPFNWVKVRC